MVPEHQALLYASSIPFVSTLFAENDADAAAAAAAPGRRPGPANKGVKFNSVGSQFKKQLAELMVQLHAMEPHYIRCIKPNESAQVLRVERRRAPYLAKLEGSPRCEGLARFVMLVPLGVTPPHPRSHSRACSRTRTCSTSSSAAV